MTRRDVAVLIPAAGFGARFGGVANKLHAMLGGRPVWQHAIDAFATSDRIATIIMAVADADREIISSSIEAESKETADLGDASAHRRGLVQLVRGGDTRADSVASMLAKVDSAIPLVAIHDAARPLLTPTDRDAVISAADRSGAAILGVPVTASLHRQRGNASRAVSREGLFAAATPQVFRRELIVRAHQRHRGRVATDDATLVQRLGSPVEIVAGRSDNLKITYVEDLAIAQAILDNRPVLDNRPT